MNETFSILGLNIDFSDLKIEFKGKQIYLYDYESIKKRFDYYENRLADEKRVTEYGVKSDIFCRVNAKFDEIQYHILRYGEYSEKEYNIIMNLMCNKLALFLVKNKLDNFHHRKDRFMECETIYDSSIKRRYNMFAGYSDEICKMAFIYRCAFRMKEKYKDKELTTQDKEDIKKEVNKTKVISRIVRWFNIMHKHFNTENIDKYESLPPEYFDEIVGLLAKHDNTKYDYEYLNQAEKKFEDLIAPAKAK